MGGPPAPGRPGPPPPGRPRPGPPPGRLVREAAPRDVLAVLGIMAGFGRGIPGRPPVPPGRGIPLGVGRAPDVPPSRRPVSGRCERPCCLPIPWAGAKGLLPGRGVPGRRGPGVGPGRGPGVGRAPPGAVGLGAGAAGRVPGFGAAGASRCSGALGLASGAAGLGAAGFGASGAAGGCVSWVGAGALGLAGVGPGFGAAGLGTGVGFGAGASGSAFLVNASRTRRTTGASSVEDGPRTYSPISPSLARSSLLVIPISLAISWTRGFATTLLHGPTSKART